MKARPNRGTRTRLRTKARWPVHGGFGLWEKPPACPGNGHRPKGRPRTPGAQSRCQDGWNTLIAEFYGDGVGSPQKTEKKQKEPRVGRYSALWPDWKSGPTWSLPGGGTKIRQTTAIENNRRRHIVKAGGRCSMRLGPAVPQAHLHGERHGQLDHVLHDIAHPLAHGFRALFRASNMSSSCTWRIILASGNSFDTASSTFSMASFMISAAVP